MNKKIFLNLILILTIGLVNAQNSFWTKTTESRLSSNQKFERITIPKQAEYYSLNYDALKSVLQTAPTRDFSGTISSLIVSFPNSEGNLEQFAIYESSVMAPELAANHPEIQAYVGQGINNPTAKIHLTTTIFGLHAMVLSDKGTYYIDPYTTDLKGYIIYNKASISSSRDFVCHSEENLEEEIHSQTNSTMISDGVFRTYRLAMACTIEYAAYHVNAAISAGSLASNATENQKKAAVLAAMNVTVSRINSVYENDMSLRMQLVANNNAIIFITSDNFNNTNAGTLINQSQTVIDGAIGFNNYDIGHTVSTGGGGLAQKPSVCTSSKAKGITGSPGPVGDPFDIDYVSHEIGHQFGADHTFNGTGGSCTGNRAPGQAVEPGSGSTIMAYAGICTNNVQSNSDAYFHAVSIAQMTSHVQGTGNCATSVSNNNASPLIEDIPNYIIPKGTPFVLTGSATDDSASTMTYCWEQTNPGANTSNPSASSTSSNPNFRSITPSVSPKRYFPAMNNILAGNLATTWEVIPNVARTLNFALTVRDNNVPDGGQTDRKNMIVTVNGTAGPFKVTSQATSTSWLPNQTQIITWDVAGTTSSPINTSNVNILLSTDGGYNYDVVLAANTPNDGSQQITVPAISAPFCRIMVQPVNNIYFAVNSATFSIGQFTTTCVTYSNINSTTIPDGAGQGVGGSVASSTINVPVNYAISNINVGVNIAHSYINDLKVRLKHPDNTSILLIDQICSSQDGINATLTDGFGSPNCSNPVVGIFDPAQPLSTFNGKFTSGDWTLEAQDFYNGDSGTINSWSIEICYMVDLNTEQFDISDLTISPNPNQGNFNIKLNSTSNQDIKINVYDISGREIFAQSYPNQSAFSQNIQLNNVQAGVYLVNIHDGNHTAVKKIIVQ